MPLACSISLLARHLTQYACISPPPFYDRCPPLATYRHRGTAPALNPSGGYPRRWPYCWGGVLYQTHRFCSVVVGADFPAFPFGLTPVDTSIYRTHLSQRHMPSFKSSRAYFTNHSTVGSMCIGAGYKRYGLLRRLSLTIIFDLSRADTKTVGGISSGQTPKSTKPCS